MALFDPPIVETDARVVASAERRHASEKIATDLAQGSHARQAVFELSALDRPCPEERFERERRIAVIAARTDGDRHLREIAARDGILDQRFPLRIAARER